MTEAVPAPAGARPFLEVERVTKRFGGLTALSEVSFTIREGEIYGLIGPNGAGKTTLFNVLTGIYRQDEGRFRFQGAELKDATPDRIAVYFDNTGGPVLESALFRMATGGRIVCCGVVSQYDTSTPGPGPRGVPGLLVNNRVRMQGFLVFDYLDRYEEARGQMRAWIADGSLRPKTTEFDGLAEAPQAFVELLNGRTVGTTIVNL